MKGTWTKGTWPTLRAARGLACLITSGRRLPERDFKLSAALGGGPRRCASQCLPRQSPVAHRVGYILLFVVMKGQSQIE